MILLLKDKMESFNEAFKAGGAYSKHDCSQLLLEKGVSEMQFSLSINDFSAIGSGPW